MFSRKDRKRAMKSLIGVLCIFSLILLSIVPYPAKAAGLDNEDLLNRTNIDVHYKDKWQTWQSTLGFEVKEDRWEIRLFSDAELLAWSMWIKDNPVFPFGDTVYEAWFGDSSWDVIKAATADGATAGLEKGMNFDVYKDVEWFLNLEKRREMLNRVDHTLSTYQQLNAIWNSDEPISLLTLKILMFGILSEQGELSVEEWKLLTLPFEANYTGRYAKVFGVSGPVKRADDYLIISNGAKLRNFDGIDAPTISTDNGAEQGQETEQTLRYLIHDIYKVLSGEYPFYYPDYVRALISAYENDYEQFQRLLEKYEDSLKPYFVTVVDEDGYPAEDVTVSLSYLGQAIGTTTEAMEVNQYYFEEENPFEGLNVEDINQAEFTVQVTGEGYMSKTVEGVTLSELKDRYFKVELEIDWEERLIEKLVQRDEVLEIKLDEEISCENLDDGVTVKNSKGEKLDHLIASCGNDRQSIKIYDPNPNIESHFYEFGQSYTIEVSKRVDGADGSAIKHPLRIQFTVEEPPPLEYLHKKWDIIFQGAGYYNGYPWSLGEDDHLYLTGYSTSLFTYSTITRDKLGEIEFSLGEAYSGGHYGVSVTSHQNGRVYVGLNGKVKSFNSDLKDEKSVPIEGSARGITIGENGNIYVTTSNNRLYMMSPDFSQINSITVGDNWRVTAPTVSADGTIYVGAGTKLYAIKSDLSGEKWAKPVDVSKINEYYTDAVTTPVIGRDGKVYVSGGNILVAVTPDGELAGKIVLSNSTSISKPVIGQDGTVYVTENRAILGTHANHALVAYKSDLSDRQKQRFTETQIPIPYANYSNLSEPVIDENGNIFFVKRDQTDTETLYLFNPQTGRNAIYTSTIGIEVPSVFDQDGTIYIGTNRGIEALALKEAKIITKPEVNEVTEQDTIVTGTAEAGLSILVKVEEAVIGRTVVQEDGTFSVNIEPQSPGTTLELTAVDDEGNTSEGMELIVLDAAPEKPTLSDITESSTSLTGTAEPGSTVTVKVGDKVIGNVMVGEDGTFSVEIEPQSPGTVLEITVRDAAGNESEVVNQTVVDAEAPETPMINEVSETSIVVTGTAERGSTVTVRVGEKVLGTAVAGEDEVFSVNIEPQAQGTILEVSAADSVGNVSEPALITVVAAGNMDKCPIEVAFVGSKAEETTLASLRDFRDDHLMKTKAGQVFVEFYYNNAPEIAGLVAGNELLKSSVKAIVTPVAAAVELL